MTGACGGSDVIEEVTWGEAATELADAVCDRLDKCGAYTGETCSETIVQYVCGYDHNCDVLVDSAVLDALDECMEAIEIAFCPNIELGYLPAECADFWDFEPDPVEVDVAGGPGNGQGSRGRGGRHE